MGLSEKTGRLVLVTLPRRLEGKADEQDELANKVCAGRALGQVRAQGTVWLFTDPPTTTTKRKDIREARSTPAVVLLNQELPNAELFVPLTPSVPNVAAGVPLTASLSL